MKRILFVLILLFPVITLYGQAIVPQLFRLDWQASFSQVEQILTQDDAGFPALVLKNTEITPESKSPRVDFITQGNIFSGIPSEITISFYNPDNTYEGLVLSWIEVTIQGEEIRKNNQNLLFFYIDLVRLFNSKYNMGLSEEEERKLYLELVYNTSLEDISVIIQVDLINDFLYLSYKKKSVTEKIAEKEKEMQEESSLEIADTDTDTDTDTTDNTGQETDNIHGQVPFSFVSALSLNPFTYNGFDNAYGNMVAAKISFFTAVAFFKLGGGLFYDYASFDGLDQNTTFHGAWALHSAAVLFSMPLFEQLGLSAALGGSWLASSFQYNNMGVERIDAFGIYLEVVLQYTLNQLIEFNLPLRSSFLFGQSFLPYFYAGFRGLFSLFLDWLPLYAELGLQVWPYSGDFFTATQPLIVFSLGTEADFSFLFK